MENQQQQDSKANWVFYAKYLVDFDRIYDQIGITDLLGAKVVHAVDPAQPDSQACCIEISAEGLARSNLQIEDAFKKYTSQAEYFENLDGIPPPDNHLLVINTVIPADSEGKKYRILAEGIQNTSLKEILSKRGKIPENEAVKMFSQLFKALEKIAEEKRVLTQLHSDFLMLDLKGDIKLSPVFFLKDANWRTKAYTCPLTKGTSLSRMLWNAGVILFEMLTGRLPWDEDTIGNENAPSQIEEDRFSDMIRELNMTPGTQDILKKILRIGEFKDIDPAHLEEKVREYITKALQITSTIMFNKSLKNHFEVVAHTGFACKLCLQKNVRFCGTRFGSFDKNESIDLCAGCFRHLRRLDPANKTNLIGRTYLKIDLPYFKDSQYNKPQEIFNVLNYLIEENKSNMPEAYQIECSLCKKVTSMMKQYHLSGNPFLNICDAHKEITLQNYLNENDINQESGIAMFIDPKCNLPTFSQANYTISKTNFNFLSGNIHIVKKKPQQKDTGKQTYLDFIENLSQTSVIKFPLKADVDKDKLIEIYKKRAYKRLKSYYLDNLLHYYGIDVYESMAYIMIEPLHEQWKPLTNNQFKAPTKASMKELMIKICRCVQSLHETGFPHGYLCPEVFLVSEPGVFHNDSQIKLAGLELFDIGIFLQGIDESLKDFQDRQFPFSIDGDIFSVAKLLEAIMAENADLVADLNQTTKDCWRLLLDGCRHPNPMFRNTIEEIIETLTNLEL